MDLASPVLQRWISEPYRTARKIHALIESAQAKPVAKYLVLDDFFCTDAIDRLREHYKHIPFSKDDDRIANGRRLPYDSSVKFADSSDVGWDLFSDPEWHAYCAHLVGAKLSEQRKFTVKLRYHHPNATGFWIHTDSIPEERSIVAIAYFNEGWTVGDGAILQMWREDEGNVPGVPRVETPDPEKPMDVLREVRIHTSTPGGRNFPRRPRDFVLIDQIVPEYNRLFLCNLQTSPAWHSVTPSRGRPRYGFVQWIA